MGGLALSGSALSFHLQCPPGVPADVEVMRAVFGAFVADDAIMTFTPSKIFGVAELSEEHWDADRVSWMIKALGFGGWARRTGVRVGANGQDEGFVRFRFSLSPLLESSIFGRTDESRLGPLLDAMVEVADRLGATFGAVSPCLLYTSPSPRDATLSRMPSSA